MEDLVNDLETNSAVLEASTEDKEMFNEHLGNSSKPRKRSRVKEIEGKQEKIERILFYLEQDYTEADIKDLIGIWTDSKTFNTLFREALAIFNEPKPVENRLKNLEEKCDDLYGKVDRLLENFAYIQQALETIQNAIEGGKRRRE